MDREIYELQQDILHKQIAVSVVLRRALVLAHAKGDAMFEAWARAELNGSFQRGEDCPDYRRVLGVPCAWLPNPGWTSTKGWRPITFDDAAEADAFSRQMCSSPIVEIERMIQGYEPGGSFTFHMTPDRQGLLNQRKPPSQRTRFAILTQRAAFDRIVEGVRNKLLDWTMQFDVSKDASEEEMSRQKLESLMNDRVSFLKADGRMIRENIKVVVDTAKNQIITFEIDLQVAEGDFFERRLPNGSVERFEVLDPGYQGGVKQIPASFQVHVRKVTDRPHPASQPTQITNVFHGDHARVNLNSIDQSTNTSSTTSTDIWTNLQATIEREVPEPAKGQLAKAVAEMKEAAGRPSFKDRYLEFVVQAANHITVLSPFLPLLANLR